MSQMAKDKQKERLVLLDAHAIIHRAYHALPDFATSSGVPTGALYGLVLMILKIVEELKADYLVACYDLPKPTYRHEVYDGYKSGRAKTDENLKVQLEKSKEICEALNIPIYSESSFEADDMLGTIVEQMKKSGIDIIIASGDMDTMQLVDDDKVRVYTLKKGIKDTILYNEKMVVERFGFPPKLLPDFKGLRGDPSDNIVGIQGIGEKSATDLIVNFGSIEEIYKTLKKNPKKLEEKGIKKRIVELLETGEEEAKFSKMLATIRRDAPIKFELPEKSWKVGVDLKTVDALFQELEFRTLGSRLRSVLNVKVEEKIQNAEDIDPVELEETKVALWVVDSNITDPTLDDILNFAKTDTFVKAKEVVFAELKKREIENVFYDIEKPLIPILRKMQERGTLIDTKFMGELDRTYSKELKELQSKIWKLAGGEEFNISSPKQLGEILFDRLGLTVKNQKKTAGGAKSTKESELEKMKDMHPIIPLILEYRELSKILGTYVEPLPKLVDANGRLHARFIQTGSRTGRMASENPNLQNIPIGSERGKVIRNAFLAEKGFVLSAFDYSQIELRIAAFLSHDKKLVEIFRNGKDVHASVAAEVFGVSESEVTKDMRRQAKVINFGILYGMGVTALQQNLGSDRKTAQEFYNTYFEKFEGLAKYLDHTKEEANRLGYTKTFFGRRRYFEGIKSKIPFIRAASERMAINAPIQGTSADLIKIAMDHIDKFITDNKLEDKVYLILQIHDELIYEIKKEELDRVAPKIIEIMQNVLSPKETDGIPILANFVSGPNWGNLS